MKIIYCAICFVLMMWQINALPVRETTKTDIADPLLETTLYRDNNVLSRKTRGCGKLSEGYLPGEGIGAGAIFGAAIGMLLMGPPGAVIGLGVGAASGGGLQAAAEC